MKLKLYSLVSLGVACLFGLCFWNNKRSYKDKSWQWRTGKSLIETLIISLSAWKFPVILVGWSTIWFTRPCKTPVYRVALGVIASVLFGFMEVYIFEAVILVSVFAIDLVTGTNGFLRHKKDLENDYGPTGNNSPIEV